MALTKLTRVLASMISLLNGGSLESAITYVTPENFQEKGEDVGNGTTDSTQAIMKAINYARANLCSIRGEGSYVISAPILVAGFGTNFTLHLNQITLASTFPSVTDENWEHANPAFIVSGAGMGNMVGLKISCDYFNGAGLGSFVRVTGDGAGGSHFHATRLTNVVNGVTGDGGTFASSSNRVTGNYWGPGLGQGVRMGRANTSTTGTNEGTHVEVDFIQNFNRGAVYLTDGAQFSTVKGQTDFNSRFLVEVSVAITAGNINTPVQGEKISNGTYAGEIIAAYEHPKGTYKVLVYNGSDCSNGVSHFSVGQTLTAPSGFQAVVTDVLVGNQGGNNHYFDVIMDFEGTPFSKCNIIMPYNGGVVGGGLYTSVVLVQNSFSATSNSIQGVGFAHDGNGPILLDSFRNSYVLSADENNLIPWRHLYLRSYKIRGIESSATLNQFETTTTFTVAYSGDGTVGGVAEAYMVTMSGFLLGVCGSFLIFVGNDGSASVRNINVDTGIFVLEAAGNEVHLTQSAQSALYVFFNYQRII